MPENTLYCDCYMSIFKAYKVVLSEPFNWDKVTYEEIEKDSLPKEIKKYYTDINIEHLFDEDGEEKF